MRKRQLALEALEKRLVLSGVGQPDQTGADWQSVIVTLKEDAGETQATASALVRSAGGELGRVYRDALHGFSANLPAAAIKALSNNPLVQSIEPNQIVQACGWPAGSSYVVPHGVDRIDADLADSPQDWGDVNVAIIDTGIDLDHPDLNVNEKVGVHYYTRLTGPPSKRGTFEDDIFADDAGHGSHVAGIVGAKDNEAGVVGVAPGAMLWSVKVLDSGGYGTLDDVIAGIDWVVTEHAADIDVINMSLGVWGESSGLRTSIQNAVAAGIVVVVAAGNDAQDVYGLDGKLGGGDDFIPAAYPEVITVSAMVDTDGIPGGFGPASGSGLDDTFANFSNYSASGAIDLVLPGVNLWSTWYDGSYVQLSGTSMAAPHAAGLAARYIAMNPGADVGSVRQALTANAVAQDDDRGLGFVVQDTDPDGCLEPIGWAGPSDSTDYPPAVSMTEPQAGATVSGTVNISAAVFNDYGFVDQVEFFVEGVSIGSDSDPDGGWSIQWSTTDSPDGVCKISAIATETVEDPSGTVTTQSGTAATIFVTVDNGTVSDAPPNVTITAPEEGQTVSGTVNVSADAFDDNGVKQVEFFVDGARIGVDTSIEGGWSVVWNTDTTDAPTFPDGAHTVTATATDTIGQTASDSVLVTVDNVQSTDTMHVGDLEGSSHEVNKRKWAATVTILVHDSDGGPVSNANVAGMWDNGISSTATTNDDGWATVPSGNVDISVSSITFTVNSITHATLDYAPASNSDADGDSDGTSIVVFQDGNTPAPEQASATDAALMAFFDLDSSDREHTDSLATQITDELLLMMME